jgi:hypothetical protein
VTRLSVVAAVVASTRVAHAHAFAQRYDLPLPLWYYLVGAGAAVALSFAAAAFAIRPSAFGHDGPRWRLPRVPGLAAACRILSVVLFVLLLLAGLLGERGEPLDNILPVSVWVIWWVGLTYVCALVGDVWRVINPLAVIARWAAALWSRITRRPAVSPCTLPSWIGVWPAVLVFFAFAWAELIWPENAVPFKLAVAIIGYAALTWLAMALFGIETWLRHGEAFALFFALVGRFAPVDTQRWQWRPFGAGLVTRDPVSVSLMAFVILVLATVTFDGLKETPFWIDLSGTMDGILYRAGIAALLGNVAAGALVKTLGLIATPLIFLAAYLAVCAVIASVLRGARDGAGNLQPYTAGMIARLFVFSLVPIAIAYHLAHYLSYLLIQGQAIIPLISDPLGRGWDVFGTRSVAIDIGIVDARLVWTICVIAIVAGHVAAVTVSHITALRMFGSPRLAVRSQYPLLVLMVGYTMLSLWILSQPLVES